MEGECSALGSVLRSTSRLMAWEGRMAPAQFAGMLAQLTQGAEALSELAESTMATMPLAAAMTDGSVPAGK